MSSVQLSPRHTVGMEKGHRGLGLPGGVLVPPELYVCEGQDVGTQDRMEGESWRERGSPGPRGSASGVLPVNSPILPSPLHSSLITVPSATRLL